MLKCKLLQYLLYSRRVLILCEPSSNTVLLFALVLVLNKLVLIRAKKVRYNWYNRITYSFNALLRELAGNVLVSSFDNDYCYFTAVVPLCLQFFDKTSYGIFEVFVLHLRAHPELNLGRIVAFLYIL